MVNNDTGPLHVSCCCVNTSYTNVTFILYFVSHSLDFYSFLPFSKLLHSLPVAYNYITFAPSAYLRMFQTLLFHDVLPIFYIRFKNVLCYYIKQYQSFESFRSLHCHYSQNYSVREGKEFLFQLCVHHFKLIYHGVGMVVQLLLLNCSMPWMFLYPTKSYAALK